MGERRYIQVPTRLFTRLTMVLILVVFLYGCTSPAAPEQTGSTEDVLAETGSEGQEEAAQESEGPIIDAIKERGTLRVGTAVALPWLGVDPQTGEKFGPAVDLSRWIADELGVELELVDSDWGVIVAGLQTDKFDLAAAGLFATEERREVVDFSIWTRAGTCYVTLPDNDKVQTLEDINNPDVTVVNLTGSATEDLMKEKYPDAQYTSIQAVQAQAILLEVLSGRVDVAPIDSPLGEAIAEVYPELRMIPEDCVMNPDIPFDVGVAYNKGDPAFAAVVDRVIAEHQEEIDQSLLEYSTAEHLGIVREQ